MEHVVFYPGADGAPAFRRVPSLEEAVRLVEHLRNVDGVAQLSVHAMTEVPMEFTTYYRVQVPTAEPASAPAQATAPAVEQAPAAAVAAPAVEAAPVEAAAVEAAPAEASEPSEAPAAEPALVTAQANGHREVGSLGFFAP